jgi:hypothetical protein
MPRPRSPRRGSFGRALASSALAAGVWLLASACGPGVATPMPEPPATTFDLNGVNEGALPASAPEVMGGGKYVTGAPGTVPAGSTVRITNLDQTTMVFATSAAPNGSFLAVVLAVDGQELRFEWTKDAQRSAPADGIAHLSDPTAELLTVEPSPRFDCVTLEPGYALDFAADSSQTLRISNGCDDALSVGNSRSRLGLTDFSLSRTLPVQVLPGETAELDFGFTRSADGLREDVLFLDLTQGAQTIRYPITLRAP